MFLRVSYSSRCRSPQQPQTSAEPSNGVPWRTGSHGLGGGCFGNHDFFGPKNEEFLQLLLVNPYLQGKFSNKLGTETCFDVFVAPKTCSKLASRSELLRILIFGSPQHRLHAFRSQLVIHQVHPSTQHFSRSVPVRHDTLPQVRRWMAVAAVKSVKGPPTSRASTAIQR